MMVNSYVLSKKAVTLIVISLLAVGCITTSQRKGITKREIIHTTKAPAAIGTYSQAVKVGNTVYLSGQIPMVADTMKVIEGDFAMQVKQVFDNLKAVAEAAGGSLDDVVKLTVFMTDLRHFSTVNEVMAEYFHKPYPARAAVGVATLAKNVSIEMDAIMYLSDKDKHTESK